MSRSFQTDLWKGVADVELRLEDDERFIGRGVALVGLYGGRGAGYFDGEAGGGVVDFGGDGAVGIADEIEEAVVEELVAHGAGLAEIEFGSGRGLGDAGGKDVVVVVDEGQCIRGDFELGLTPIATGDVEIGVPADAGGAGFRAGIDGGDLEYEGLRTEGGVELNFECAGPFALKRFFPGGFKGGAIGIGNAAGNGRGLIEEEAVHGVGFGAGILADPVGGEFDGFAGGLRFDGAGFGVELAADAVGVGDEKGAAVLKGFIAAEIVFGVVHELGCFAERGGGEEVGDSFPGDVGAELPGVETAAGKDYGINEERGAASFGSGATERDGLLAAEDFGAFRDREFFRFRRGGAGGESERGDGEPVAAGLFGGHGKGVFYLNGGSWESGRRP